MESTSACRPRFSRPVFLWALVALLVEFVLDWFLQNGWHPPFRSLTLLPLIPIAFFIGYLVRTILKMDELQRRICMESLSIAFILTLSVTFILAALERAGFYHASDGIGTFMLFSWACAYIFTSRRYR